MQLGYSTEEWPEEQQPEMLVLRLFQIAGPEGEILLPADFLSHRETPFRSDCRGRRREAVRLRALHPEGTTDRVLLFARKSGEIPKKPVAAHDRLDFG